MNAHQRRIARRARARRMTIDEDWPMVWVQEYRRRFPEMASFWFGGGGSTSTTPPTAGALTMETMMRSYREMQEIGRQARASRGEGKMIVYTDVTDPEPFMAVQPLAEFIERPAAELPDLPAGEVYVLKDPGPIEMGPPPRGRDARTAPGMRARLRTGDE